MVLQPASFPLQRHDSAGLLRDQSGMFASASRQGVSGLFLGTRNSNKFATTSMTQVNAGPTADWKGYNEKVIDILVRPLAGRAGEASAAFHRRVTLHKSPSWTVLRMMKCRMTMKLTLSQCTFTELLLSTYRRHILMRFLKMKVQR